MNRHVKHFFMIKEFKGSISCLLRHYNTAILVIISKLCKQNGAFFACSAYVLFLFCVVSCEIYTLWALVLSAGLPRLIFWYASRSSPFSR